MKGFGIDPSILDRMALEIKNYLLKALRLVWYLAVTYSVVQISQSRNEPCSGRPYGYACHRNERLAMRDALHRAEVNAKLMSAFRIKWDLRHLQLV